MKSNHLHVVSRVLFAVGFSSELRLNAAEGCFGENVAGLLIGLEIE